MGSLWYGIKFLEVVNKYMVMRLNKSLNLFRLIVIE